MVWNHISDEDCFRINTNVQHRFSSKTSFNFISFRFVPKSNAPTYKFKLHKDQFHCVSKISYWNIRIAFWLIDIIKLHSLDSYLIRKYLFSFLLYENNGGNLYAATIQRFYICHVSRILLLSLQVIFEGKLHMFTTVSFIFIQ